MLRAGVLVAGCGLAMLPASAPEVQDPGRVVIKCATVAPDGSTWMKLLEKMSKDIYRRTRGRVQFKFFANGVLGEEKSVLEKISYGQIQSAGLTGIGMGEILPECRVIELPYWFDTYEDYDYVLERLGPRFEKGFEEKGFVLLGWAEGGFANLWSKRPLRTPEDLQQAKVWLRLGDPMTETILRQMGIQPVPLALGDVLTSLQTGLIDTVYVSPLALIALQWFPHVEYCWDVPLFNIEAGLVVDLDTWNSLRPEDRETVRTSARKHLRELVERTRKDNAESVQVLKDKGIRFLKPDAAERARLEELRDRIAGSLVGRLYDRELLEEFRRLVAEARARKKQ